MKIFIDNNATKTLLLNSGLIPAYMHTRYNYFFSIYQVKSLFKRRGLNYLEALMSSISARG